MRRLTLREPWRLELESLEPAPLRAGEVRVAVAATGICASDVHGYAGRSSRRPPGTVMGHEVAGTVIETAAETGPVGVGERVAVNPVVWCGTCEKCTAGHPNLCRSRRLYGCTPALPGGFADQLVVREQNTVSLADELPFEVASLIEPLAVGVHAAGQAQLTAEDSVLVLGGGMIGLAAALAAARVAPVLIAEPDHHRRLAGERLGLSCREPSQIEQGAYSVVLECVGGIGLLDAAVRYSRSRGRIVAVGLADERVELAMSPIVMEERTITGSAVYTDEEFADTANWVSAEHQRLSHLVEERVDLDRLPAAIDRLATGKSRQVRTVLTLE